jgi:NAD(P)-dependent dehydrogenase (short-subunit alcohol dehydrogenase family)
VAADFSNQVVFVAGGTGGLGRAVSRALLDAGASVIVGFRTPQEFDTLRIEAQVDASRLQGERMDATDEAAVRGVVERIAQRHGRLDALVNAIGGYAGGAPLWQVEPAVLERMFALNLRPSHVLARAVLPLMLQQQHGAIVGIAARAGLDHPAGAGAYAASKAAALALMDSLAADVAGSGVRVNSVLPSIIDTPANREAMPGADFARWPKPEDIARVVLFLCSDEARVIHGASIPVYGAG